MTLDTLHAYCGPVPTVEARRLEVQSCQCKYFIRHLVLICPKSWSICSYLIVTFVVDMELGLKRALGVKKAATLQSKACNSSTPAAKTSLKRKNQADRGHTTKKTVNQLIISDPTGSQGIPSPPRHGTGKGLMSACGPIINEPIPQALLLVRDKQHAI